MAREKGLLVHCDRCGETVFLKITGNGEADGGWTRWDKFEPYPEGWSDHWITGKAGTSTLCPACSAEYEGIAAEFMRKGKG